MTLVLCNVGIIAVTKKKLHRSNKNTIFFKRSLFSATVPKEIFKSFSLEGVTLGFASKKQTVLIASSSVSNSTVVVVRVELLKNTTLVL